MALTDALEDLAELLRSAGIDADYDPQRAPVPGAWLHADGLMPLTLGGIHEVRVNVHLVVPDHGTRASLDALETMLAAALGIVTPRSAVELDGYVETPRGRLPCFTIPTTLDITI